MKFSLFWHVEREVSDPKKIAEIRQEIYNFTKSCVSDKFLPIVTHKLFFNFSVAFLFWGDFYVYNGRMRNQQQYKFFCMSEDGPASHFTF